MKRRKFIYILSIGSIGVVSANYLNKVNNKLISNIDYKKKNIILDYNKKRFKSLKNNLEEEIKRDFKNNKTIFLGDRIYTFAELNFLK